MAVILSKERMKCINKHALLTILTVVGVVGGTITAAVIRATSEQWSKRDIMYLSFPGDMFLRMLKSLIIPLLTSSIISAVGSLDLSLSKKIAMRSILYYATTTICAVILGIILVLTVRPGVDRQVDVDEKPQVVKPVLTQDTLLDLVRNLFPPNLVQATIQQSSTELSEPVEKADQLKIAKARAAKQAKYGHSKNVTDVEGMSEIWGLMDFKESYSSTTNVLGLVVFSVVLGVVIGKMKEKGEPLLVFFHSLSEAMMIITNWVIWFSPIGVFFLVTGQILQIENIAKLAGQLSIYFFTVLLGLFIHGFGTISIIFFVCTRTLPFRTISKLSRVLATAFGTASSSATMPITIQTLDEIGVDPRVTRFVIPVGATINMDGTALYEAVAAIFIAQLERRSLSFGQAIGVCVTATAASIGAAGIPQAGLVTMVMVLDTVGLPAEKISIILAVDWLLDRFRTTINVMCDSLGAQLVDVLSRKDLMKADERDKANADPHELVEMAKDDKHSI